MISSEKKLFIGAFCLLFLGTAFALAQADLKVGISCPGSALAGQELGKDRKSVV